MNFIMTMYTPLLNEETETGANSFSRVYELYDNEVLLSSYSYKNRKDTQKASLQCVSYNAA